ncbi:MAG: peptidoglycan-binding protein [Clostridia bacterium]|nr:peptidoglycan-binding protein [Clostridia bacterium]
MTPTLHYCHRNNEVARLQLMLRELDFSLEPDGIFGPMTQECVKTFQALHGLPSTGSVDPATWDALEQCVA